MNEQLKREEDDLCGKRGLEPNTERQTFEVEVPFKFREQYDDVVRPLRQSDIQQQRRNVPNNPTGKFPASYYSCVERHRLRFSVCPPFFFFCVSQMKGCLEKNP